jgi:hypothetical protein
MSVERAIRPALTPSLRIRVPQSRHIRIFPVSPLRGSAIEKILDAGLKARSTRNVYYDSYDNAN